MFIYEYDYSQYIKNPVDTLKTVTDKESLCWLVETKHTSYFLPPNGVREVTSN